MAPINTPSRGTDGVFWTREKMLYVRLAIAARDMCIWVGALLEAVLNLTAANRVFIIEPQWNPSVENQAISRAIRMNQTDSVTVTRYTIRGTVEQARFHLVLVKLG
ncbi:hypothetical protein IFR05_002619 [Cadophora sp. M221]|nr:hypothetical protein IFR05_002619 [Cadophora sp. M221]